MNISELDAPCVKLCQAINRIPGLRTTQSCCGHGKRPFIIWFEVIDPKNLPILLYYCDPCHVGFHWHCKVTTDCAMSTPTYRIESQSKGKKAYKEATMIAEKLEGLFPLGSHRRDAYEAHTSIIKRTSKSKKKAKNDPYPFLPTRPFGPG